MSANDRLQMIAEKLSRRRLLSRVGVAAAGGVAWAMGRSMPASAAVRWRCCNLCYTNIGPTSCLNNSQCYAVWAWSCWSSGHWYNCSECFRRGYTPNGTECGYPVVCSFGYEMAHRSAQ